jgi:hypothetical protein
LLLVIAVAWYSWPRLFPVHHASSEAAVFEVATGVWDWKTSKGFCEDNPHLISFSADQTVMTITSRRPWADTAAADDRIAVYDIMEHTSAYIRGALRGEDRLTDAGKPVVWDLVLTSPDSYAWHRTDWLLGMQTGDIKRCPAGTDTLIKPVAGTGLDR